MAQMKRPPLDEYVPKDCTKCKWDFPIFHFCAKEGGCAFEPKGEDWRQQSLFREQ